MAVLAKKYLHGAFPKMLNSKQRSLERLAKAADNAIPNHKRKVKKTRIPLPELPSDERLSDQERWASLMWNIETAEAHGIRALRGLTLALTRMIQADILEGLLLDARHGARALNSPDELLWDSSLPVCADGSTMHDLLRPRRKIPPQELTQTAVIPQPWERWRMSRALQQLGPGGEWGVWRQTANIHAVGWTPWPLVWIDNGNHSTMAAMLTHGGKLMVSECLDAKALLLSVYCDGADWLSADEGRIIAPARSLPMAGIFEIGRRLVRAPKNGV